MAINSCVEGSLLPVRRGWLDCLATKARRADIVEVRHYRHCRRGAGIHGSV
jgi:hypothetical protein